MSKELLNKLDRTYVAVDNIGQELRAGDRVVYTSSYGRSKQLCKGYIIGFKVTPKQVKAEIASTLDNLYKANDTEYDGWLSTSGKLTSGLIKIPHVDEV